MEKQHMKHCTLDTNHSGPCEHVDYDETFPLPAEEPFKQLADRAAASPKASEPCGCKIVWRDRDSSRLAGCDDEYPAINASQCRYQPMANAALVVRCHKCQGAVIYKRHDDHNIEVFHGCGDKASEREQALQELKQKLLACNTGDAEADHANADIALLDFINDTKVTELYSNIKKWYA